MMTLPEVAVMLAVPAAKLVDSPTLSMVAMAVSSRAQVTMAVMLAVVLSV